MFLIPPDSLSRLLVVMVATVVKKMNFLAVLDPLIKTFMQVALLIGPLSFVGLVFYLGKLKKIIQNVYVGSNEKRKSIQLRFELSRKLLAENINSSLYWGFYLLGNDFSKC